MSVFATFECPECGKYESVRVNVDVLADRWLEFWCENCPWSKIFGKDSNEPKDMISEIHKSMSGHENHI